MKQFNQNKPKEPPKRRWYIRIQMRADYNGRYGRNDWRSWRRFCAWPITFATCAEAEAFMRENFTFKNLHGRKMSASACVCGPIRK